MSKFESGIKMKLGEILKTFTTSTYAMDASMETSIKDALPIWDLLGITETEYYIKYSVDISGNNVPPVVECVPAEIVEDVAE